MSVDGVQMIDRQFGSRAKYRGEGAPNKVENNTEDYTEVGALPTYGK